ncbi:flagellar hook capping FlgD N-terminal domain-containing protein [Cellulomonas taurus]|uniref:flagellar hook capping FlgD N-terminal domain-containing protein n=1 Tax=Cellulomonas taurus TaxID=2729175 RepID=UPI00145F05A8|nr:flagellar hook capping FlgD N-terminal domain-containing protein [Cellulomonas taurus]
MSVDVSYITGGTGSTGATPKTASNELDRQAFLNLFVAQLKYQDPSSPMDTSAMMAQTTQLSTMESLEEMTATSRETFALQMRMSAADLVGKQVSWVDEDKKTQNGTVSGVSYSGSVPVVLIGDKQISLNSISFVATPGGPTELPETTDDTQS